MEAFWDIGLNYGVVLILLVIGFSAGRIAEARHYRSIHRREAASTVMVFSDRSLPEGATESTVKGLVLGSVVVSNDYFKAALAGLRKLFGGRIGAYETLIDRARREAVLRMKSEATQKGGTAVVNVRFETSSISKGRGLTSVEVLAYGTAVA